MPEVHISSLVVHVRPDRSDAARVEIEAMPGAEIAHCHEGKLVVVLETPSDRETMARISAIQEIPGTIAASLIYHEIDDAPASQYGREEMPHV